MGSASDDVDAMYPLGALQRLRVQEQEQCTQDLAVAIAETQRAQRHVDECKQAATQARVDERMHVKRSASRSVMGTGIANLLADQRYRERLLSTIDDADRAVTDAHARMANQQREETAARERLADAVRARESLDVHYEAWQAKRNMVRKRKQERDVEDVAQIVYRAQQKTDSDL